MVRMRLSVLAAIAPLCLLATAAAAQEQADGPAEAAAVMAVEAANLSWSAVEVPGFAPGLQLAVVNGDPSKVDEAYTMRLRFPDGYAFPPHWHPRDENVTVLSGRFYLAMGTKTDPDALRAYSPGDYIFAPGNMAHFGRVEGETTIQLHGIGPFTIQVVEGQEMQ